MKVMIRVLSIGLTLALLCALPALMQLHGAPAPLAGAERTLLRIWIVSSPGGGPAWLNARLKSWQKTQRSVSTYVRTVRPEDLTADGAVLPDVVLYMPGDITSPEALFLPLSGAALAENSAVRESLLRCGRWQGQQYGLPLCWGAWVLAIDGTMEETPPATPAPTTLLGRPAITQAPEATATPPYPRAARAADVPLQSPGGTALMTLCCILPPEERPDVPEDFAHPGSADVYSRFRQRQCASAMLTTGQVTALESLTSAGQGFPFRVMTPGEVITDQVWLASITPGADAHAAALLGYLIAPQAQSTLASQGLHTVRDDMSLYASGTAARVEQAGRYALSVINAYHPREMTEAAAWRVFQGSEGLSQALIPLL